MKKNTTIVKDINKMLPPANPEYPCCFIRDGLVIVSGEVYVKESYKCEDGTSDDFELPCIDYYGEFRGGYAWIHAKLEAYADKLRGYWEWENPACVIFVCN